MIVSYFGLSIFYFLVILSQAQVFLLNAEKVRSVKGKKFTYDQPHIWFRHFPRCAGLRQSPISLHTSKVIQADLPPLQFYHYDVHFHSPLKVHNNGLTVEIETETTENGENPTITGGGVDDDYELEGFHFHWGAANRDGSEHAVDGKRYDMEMHLVHKNKRCKTMKEALTHPFGILVLGILFEAVDYEVNQTGLNAIYDILPQLRKYDSKVYLERNITAGSLLKLIDTSNFYTYRGSLTTPPCAEVVTWFIFEEHFLIHNDMLERFRCLYDSRSLPVQNNIRPLQSRNHRRVYYRKSCCGNP